MKTTKTVLKIIHHKGCYFSEHTSKDGVLFNHLIRSVNEVDEHHTHIYEHQLDALKTLAEAHGWEIEIRRSIIRPGGSWR